ncbi:hypothetical protein ABK040_009013 [Willaertia magna]
MCKRRKVISDDEESAAETKLTKFEELNIETSQQTSPFKHLRKQSRKSYNCEEKEFEQPEEKEDEKFIENMLLRSYQSSEKFIKSLMKNLMEHSSIDFQLTFYEINLKEEEYPVKLLAKEISKEWRLLEEPPVKQERPTICNCCGHGNVIKRFYIVNISEEKEGTQLEVGRKCAYLFEFVDWENDDTKKRYEIINTLSKKTKRKINKFIHSY